MGKPTTCIAVIIFQVASAFAAEAEHPDMTVMVGAATYAIPEDFLGQVVPRPEQSQGILTLHVRYPDLVPVGNTSGKCPRKIALTDENCPYFSIFLLPNDEHLPRDYDGLIRNLPSKSEGVVDGYDVFSFSSGKEYRWAENGASRSFICSGLSCDGWGRTEHGGAYRLVFSSAWWRDGKRLCEEAAALVDGFRQAASRGQ